MKDMNDFLSYMMSDETATGNMQTLQEAQKNRSGSSNLFFRYKRMPIGASTTVRFLPASQDIAANSARPAFWLPKKVIRLRFDNPEQAGSECVLTIPVMQMYKGGKNEDDLVLRQVKPLYDEADALAKKGKEEQAKELRSKASYHWTRGECLAQGFVVRSGLNETEEPENPIRLFELNKQIMNIIQGTVNSEDPDTKLKYWPVHGKFGSNFVIKKTQSGEFNSYITSCFAREPSPWTTVQTDAIAQHGLWNLTDFLPTQPTAEEYELLAHIMSESLKMTPGNRVWNVDWEAGLVNVRVFKTNQSTSEDEESDNETIQARTREVLSQIGAGTMESTDEVVASLSQKGDAEPVSPDIEKRNSDARSLIEKIKRGAKSAAAA